MMPLSMPTAACAENIFLMPLRGLSFENLGFSGFIVNRPRVCATTEIMTMNELIAHSGRTISTLSFITPRKIEV